MSQPLIGMLSDVNGGGASLLGVRDVQGGRRNGFGFKASCPMLMIQSHSPGVVSTTNGWLRQLFEERGERSSH